MKHVPRHALAAALLAALLPLPGIAAEAQADYLPPDVLIAQALAGQPEVQAAAIEAFRKAAQDPEAKTVWAGQGADFPNVTGAQFGKLIHDEIRKWADVVKASGAKLE